MFKIVSLLFALLVVIGIGVMIFPVKEKDFILYETLVKSSQPSADAPLLSYSQQKREKVCKQIWYQDDSPLYFRIESEESELFFFRQNNRVEVVEELGSVICIMQEELYFENNTPMQRIRYLEAERASYNYNTHLFIAEVVKLWKYQLEGHTLPQHIVDAKPLMQATAHSVEFTLRGEKLDFVAHQMRATMNSNERSL